MLRLVLSVVALAALPGQSLAQTTPPASAGFLTEAPDALRASRVKGLSVVGQDHVRVGEIEDLLLGVDGRIVAVVIGVGGFLGMGEKAVAVPWSELRWNTGDVSRVAVPSNGQAPGAGARAGNVPSGGAERMPGAQMSNEALVRSEAGQGREVHAESGPVSGNGSPATVLVIPAGGKLERAEISLTKAELERAPAFKFRPSPD